MFSDEEYGEKSVSVLLDGEESELIFVDHSSGEMSVSLFHFIMKHTLLIKHVVFSRRIAYRRTRRKHSL